MGDGFVEYDNFIPGFFDMLNLRFAPPPNPTQDEWVGGIEEVPSRFVLEFDWRSPIG
jgi:hypothetical protein